MSYAPDDRFEAWKEKGEAVGLLAAAQMFGAKLKKHGTEWVGPCPNCSGRDRFAVNVQKSKWHCRGHGGGTSVIAMAMHIGNLSFKESIEQLTGGPCPSGGPARPLSDVELAERNRRRLVAEDAQRRREAEEAAYQDDTREAAQRIWEASAPLMDDVSVTKGHDYLMRRGLALSSFDVQWPDCLRFNARLPYPKKPGNHPALICRVDDMSGELCAVWRIFLNSEGGKLDVDNPKLGLGPAGGGAVRIGGVARKIGLAEGLESALGAWNLIGRKYPVWAALSTSGLVGIELPLGIEHVVIFPDGDASMKKKDGEYVPSIPAGRKAATTLRARLLAEGVGVTISAEPSAGKDYCDLWLEYSREIA